MTSPATAILLAATLIGVVSAATRPPDPPECVPEPNQNLQILHRDKFTVLMNGFSESRIPLLQSLAATYSLSPIVLNNRFLLRPNDISTNVVLVCDDDVEVDPTTLEFAFRVWRQNPHQLVGLFARSHDFDLDRKEWAYTVHPDRFSIVLTKFMLLKTRYVFLYTCRGGPCMARVQGSWTRCGTARIY
ncbi:hypothetical protein JHK85_040531 [Glycine max]|nr:hypothetical protein JHK85_040531 [Glycine max]